MTIHSAVRLALGALSAIALAGAASAQEIPEGQSCGGLVCDLGLFGHKVAPKPAAELAPVPATAAPTQAAAPGQRKPRGEAAQVERKPARKKAHVAKAAPPPARKEAARAAAMPAAPMPAVSLASPPFSAIAVPDDGVAAPLAAKPPPPVPVTPPPPAAPVVMANPYVYTRPLPFLFQSVDPTQGVQ